MERNQERRNKRRDRTETREGRIRNKTPHDK